MSQPDEYARAYLLFDPAELQYDFGEGHPLQRSQVIGSHWSYAPVRIAIPPPMAPRPMNASITTSAIRILCKQKLRDTLLRIQPECCGLPNLSIAPQVLAKRCIFCHDKKRCAKLQENVQLSGRGGSHGKTTRWY